MIDWKVYRQTFQAVGEGNKVIETKRVLPLFWICIFFWVFFFDFLKRKKQNSLKWGVFSWKFCFFEKKFFFSLIFCGRRKKNWKTLKIACLASLCYLFVWILSTSDNGYLLFSSIFYFLTFQSCSNELFIDFHNIFL